MAGRIHCPNVYRLVPIVSEKKAVCKYHFATEIEKLVNTCPLIRFVKNMTILGDFE